MRAPPMNNFTKSGAVLRLGILFKTDRRPTFNIPITIASNATDSTGLSFICNYARKKYQYYIKQYG